MTPIENVKAAIAHLRAIGKEIEQGAVHDVERLVMNVRDCLHLGRSEVTSRREPFVDPQAKAAAAQAEADAAAAKAEADGKAEVDAPAEAEPDAAQAAEAPAPAEADANPAEAQPEAAQGDAK